MFQTNAFQQPLLLGQKRAKIFQGPARLEPPKVARRAGGPLPDRVALLGRQPCGGTAARQHVHAGETFLGERVQVGIDRVGMDVQCRGNRRAGEAEPVK